VAYQARAGRRWKAVITVHGKGLYLGYFKTPEAAHMAYCAAADKHFGEYARYA
jgi:hypothetical protein